MGTTLSDLTEDYPGQSFAPCPICPVCAASSRILHSASNIHPDKPYAFNFRVCSTCSHGWIDPMPTQGLLNYLYGRGSRSVIGEWGPNQLTIPEQVCVRREMKRTPGRYFELGVGDGHLYRLFVERGWKCTGLDPGDWAAGFPTFTVILVTWILLSPPTCWLLLMSLNMFPIPCRCCATSGNLPLQKRNFTVRCLIGNR